MPERPQQTNLLLHSLRHRDRDGSRGGVPVLGDVAHHLLGSQPEALGGGVDDALVRLVHDQKVDVLARHPRLLQRLRHRVRHSLDRELEHLLTVHPDVAERAARRRRVTALRRRFGLAARVRPRFVRELRGEVMVPRPVGVHVEPQEAAVGRVRRRRQHHGAAPVSEEDARPAVAPVDVAGEDVRADDEDVEDNGDDPPSASRSHGPS